MKLTLTPELSNGARLDRILFFSTASHLAIPSFVGWDSICQWRSVEA